MSKYHFRRFCCPSPVLPPSSEILLGPSSLLLLAIYPPTPPFLSLQYLSTWLQLALRTDVAFKINIKVNGLKGQWKTIWKSDSYWIVLDLRIALCTLHQLGGERWLDWRGSRDIRKMGPVMDACGRLREKPQASPCSRAVQTLALCMVECWRNPDIPKLKEKGERGGKRREGGGRGGGGGGNHHQLPCCMSQAPNHSL